MKKCNTCGKELNIGFFNEQSGDDCVLCVASRVELAPIESHDHEEVEDTGCAGGACTL